MADRVLRIDGKPVPCLDDLVMADYRKRPVIVQAIQINVPFTVETLEGTMRGNAGDYLIRGVNGEYYPCKPDIFEKTYEPA
jgi:hypothetical protein